MRLLLVELLGVEADRADVVAAAGRLVALHQVGERRAAVAGDADGGAVDGEADRFLGEEHERRAAGFGGADRDEEGDMTFSASSSPVLRLMTAFPP